MRPASAARFLLGAVGLLFTRRLLPLWGANPSSERVVAVARVLAARHIVQGAVVGMLPGRRSDLISAAVDAAHGVTMVALAVVTPSSRRPAATSASAAFIFAALSYLRSATDATDNAGGPDVATGRAIPLKVLPSQPPPCGERKPDGALTERGEPNVERIEAEAHRRAAWLTRRSEQVLSASQDAPVRSLSPAGAWTLLTLGVWLLVGQWLLNFPLTSVASSTGTRDEGFAVVLILAAMRLLVANRSFTATGITLVCGVLLMLSGLLLEHSVDRSAVNEVLAGGLALLCGAATLDRWRAGAGATENRAVVTGSA